MMAFNWGMWPGERLTSVIGGRFLIISPCWEALPGDHKLKEGNHGKALWVDLG